MEWYKIKNILITALILTNLLLIVVIFVSNNSTKNSEDVLLTGTIALLKDNGINLNESVEIPKTEEKMSVITLSYDSQNGTVNNTNQNNISDYKNINTKKALEIAEKELYSLNLNTKINNELKREYILKINKGNSYEVKYCNYYNGLKIEDSYILFQISPKGVEKITRNLAYAESSGKSKQKIISITTALLKYMNQIKAESSSNEHEITDISMIYKVDSPYKGNATTDTAFPSWKITSNNKTMYISAYN